jgi:hypothetical protein
MANKKVSFFTFEKMEGREQIGSSRIRARWVAKYWDEAEIYKEGKKYETVIYQKAYFVEHAKIYDGIKILDLCDPDWLHWAYRTKEMIELCDAVTTSTEALAEAVKKFTNKPVYCVPDRLDLSLFTDKKVHNGKAKTALWYGYSNNIDLLKPVINYLIKHNLDLIILSDKEPIFLKNETNKIDIQFYKYKEETANEVIIKADMVINPVSKQGKWKYKSNNKTITAWALGVPVVESPEDIEKFMDGENRKREAEKRWMEVKDKYAVELSVNQYKQIIDDIKKNKKNTTDKTAKETEVS